MFDLFKHKMEEPSNILQVTKLRKMNSKPSTRVHQTSRFQKRLRRSSTRHDTSLQRQATLTASTMVTKRVRKSCNQTVSFRYPTPYLEASTKMFRRLESQHQPTSQSQALVVSSLSAVTSFTVQKVDHAFADRNNQIKSVSDC